MASGQLTLVVRHIHKLAGVTPVEDLADGQLLERFLASHEEEAFTALVRRHGSMVLGVCRRILRNRHAAEDAFQATFLVLLRKARSLDRRGSVASWLYTVAYHVALKARASDARRQQRERKVSGSADAIQPPPTWDDLQPLLDEELNRLPETYRDPLVLCYLEGRTNAEAAQLLGWPLGTVKGRLARARELLRNRLLRRGVTLSGSLVAATLPASLVQAAVRTALPQFGASAGVASASAVALAEGALQTMFTSKLKLVAALLLLTGLAIFGLGSATPQAQAQKQEGITIKIVKPAESKQGPAGKPAPGGKEDKVIRVDGSVLGSDGKGLAGAEVRLVAWPSRRATDKPRVLAQGRTDQAGKFRLKAERPADAAVILLASARGHGPGWHWPTDSKSVEVRLAPEQVIRGRLFDLQGQPAAGVKLHVTRLGGQVSYDRAVSYWLAGGSSGDDDFDDPIPGRVPPRGGRLGTGMMRGDVMVWDASNDPKRPVPPGLGAPLPLEGLPGWPAAVTTDKEGRFELRGVGKGQGVGLQVRDDRFALQSIDIAAQEKAAEVTHVLAPRRTLEGVITDADTGKPIPHARVRVYPPPGQYGRLILSAGSSMGDNSDEKGRRGLGATDYAVLALSEALAVGGSGELPPLDIQADEQGRYKVNLFRGGSYSLRAGGPRGEPYLSRGLRVSWPQEAVVRKQLNIELQRGVRVRGKVVEEGGKAVANARVDFWSRDLKLASGTRFPPPLTTDTDGTFEALLPPGSWHLLVNGPEPVYRYQSILATKLTDKEAGQQGKERLFYPDAWTALDLKSGAAPRDVTFTLKRAPVLRGQVVGPDGKPVAGVRLVRRPALHSEPVVASAEKLWRMYFDLDPKREAMVRDLEFFITGRTTRYLEPVKLGDGTFAFPALDPNATYPLHFLDPTGKFGASVELKASQAGGAPVTVRLQPCGSAQARFTDAKGQALADYRPLLWLLVPPGPHPIPKDLAATIKGGLRSTHALWAAHLDPERHGEGPRTDSEGCVTLTGLIPGATYRLLLGDGQVRDFTARANATINLDNLVVPQPEPNAKLPRVGLKKGP